VNRTTYINLPVQDLDRATAFFAALGFPADPRISSDDTRCVVVGDATLLMLHTADFFATFTGGPVTDPETAREVTVGLSAERRGEVDEMLDRAVAAGGTDAGAQDEGYMYMRAFRDLDGHQWSLIHLAG
jgi:predicted lactoylglutathione lyase